MADVEVRFGANIQSLVSGIDQVKSSIDSIRSRLDGVAEAFGVAFSVEGIEKFVESTAALGSKIESVGAMLGASNQEVIELGGFAKLAGVSLDSFAQGFDRLTLNIQKSTKDGLNPAAQALRVLQLNARDLIGLGAEDYFIKLADAVSRFNPSLNLTNALTALGVRNAAAWVPVLLQGGEHFREFKAAVDQASEGLAAAVPGMANTHEKLVLLGASAESLGARVFSTLKPAIDAAITGLTGFIQKLDTGTIRGYALALTDTLGNAIAGIAGFFGAASVTVDDFNKSLDNMLSKADRIGKGSAFGAAVGGGLGALTGVGALPGAAAGAGVGGYIAANSTPIPQDQYEAEVEAIQAGDYELAAAIANGSKKVEETTKQGAGQVADSVSKGGETIVDRIRQMQAQIKAALLPHYNTADLATALGMPKGGDKLNAGGINFGAGDSSKAAMEAAQGQIKAAELAYQGIAEKLKSAFDLHKITEDQKTAATVAAVNVREDAEMKALDAELARGGLSLAETEKIENQRSEIILKAINDRQKAQDEGLKEDTKEWQTALAPIESAWNSQLRSLLSGTETFSAAMKKVFGDLVLDAIEQFEKLAVEKAAAGLAGSVGGTGTGGGLLGGIGSLVGSLFGGGGQSAALATAGTTLTTAGTSLNASAAALSGAAATLTGSAGAGAAGGAVSGAASGAGGGLFGDILGKVGGLIGDMVIPGFATGAWEIPSAAGGMWTVGGGGSLAVLHPRETVLPSAAATGFRAMAEGRMPGQGGDNAAMAGHMARQTRTMQDIHEALTSNTASQRRSNSSLESSVDQLRRALIRR